MDIHKFEIFIDLSETLNYTETAEHLFTTQGNISKQIIALEKELGVGLFSRSHRKIELTEAGRLALPFTKKIVAQYDGLTQTLHEYENEKNLVLKVLTIPTMSNYRGFSKITEFLKHHPEIHLQLQEYEGIELTPEKIQGKNTILFARTFAKLAENLEAVITEKDRFTAILPSDHPLAHQSSIELAQLQQENFLLLGKDTNLFEPVMDLCRKAAFEPRITYEGHRIDLIINMVSNGLGVSLLMEKTAAALLTDRVTAVPVTPNCTSYLSFIKRRTDHSKAAELFWQFLKGE